MGNVPNQQKNATSHRRESICFRCQQSVIWLPFEGKPAAIEPCAAGRGNIAIQTTILAGINEAIRVSGPTSWRLHMEHCKAPGSFSGAAPRKKSGNA